MCIRDRHTPPARRAAAARLVAFRQLYDALERELTGDDLLS